MLPNGWSIKTIGDLFDVQLGKMLNQEAKEKEPQYKYLGNTNVQWARFNLENLKSMHFNQSEQKKFKLEKNDILMCEGGEVGRCAIWDKEDPIFYQKALHRLRSKGNIDPIFFQNFMEKIAGTKLLEDYTTKTSIAHLSQEKLIQLPVRLPPLSEQKKIAQILSTWDKAIATTEKLLENSQKQKQALMQQLLTGKKRFPEYNEHWVTYMLEELEDIGWLELGRGNVISKTDIENHPGDNPIYSSSIKNQGLMGNYANWMFDEELISWSVDGGGNFFYRHKHKFSITNVSGWMRVDTTKLNYKFMAYQLSYLHEKLKFDYQSKAHPSVIRKLYKLNIPTLPEQESIASVLSVADKHINSLEKKLNLLKLEKRALMQQLLTGKRRVRTDS